MMLWFFFIKLKKKIKKNHIIEIVEGYKEAIKDYVKQK